MLEEDDAARPNVFATGGAGAGDSGKEKDSCSSSLDSSEISSSSSSSISEEDGLCRCFLGNLGEGVAGEVRLCVGL
jgi:hypothetical protein